MLSRKILFLGIILLTFFSIILGAVSVWHGEVNFFNDIARDFLLLQELDAKKIVFIGPRSSTMGLFHGVLWTYLNYPAYLLGHGNPVVVAWFWFILGIIFVVTSYLIAKRMVGGFAASIFSLLLATKIVPHINGVLHAEATIFIMPLFFYSIYEYIKTKNNKFLIYHLISLAVITQLNIGVGIQFIILSTFVILIVIVRNRLWTQLLSFIVLPIFLVNFILFDLKHHFQLARAILMTGGATKFFIPVGAWIMDRIGNIYSLQLVENAGRYQLILILIFLVVLVAFYNQATTSKNKLFYLLFAFYYLGYMSFSFFNKSVLLFHYLYLLIPLSYLLLVSFLNTKYRAVFVVIIAIVYAMNLSFAINFVNSLKDFYGRNPNSWLGLTSVARSVVSMQNGGEFGYFVFSPDAFAYQPRYAMIYTFNAEKARAHEYTKKPITYVIAQGAPANDPYMTYKWWVKVPVGISNQPTLSQKFENNYTVLRYELNDVDQKIPYDQNINLGIHFR